MRRIDTYFGTILFLLSVWATPALAEKSKAPVIQEQELPEATIQTEKGQPNLNPTAPGQAQLEPQTPKSQPAAPNYDLSWFSINGGGTHSGTSTNYELGYSIGQSVAGEGNSTNYSLGIGFWYGAGTNCIAIPADANNSGGITLGDIVHLVNYAFDKDKLPCLGLDPGNCWEPVPICRADVNGSGGFSLGDIVHLVNYIFDKDRLPCIGLDPSNCWPPEAIGSCCSPVP
jgi:hypothetical protein